MNAAVSSLFKEVGIELPTDAGPDSRLVDDLGLDSLHLVELAYACDGLMPMGYEPDFPFFETLGEVEAFVVAAQG